MGFQRWFNADACTNALKRKFFLIGKDGLICKDGLKHMNNKFNADTCANFLKRKSFLIKNFIKPCDKCIITSSL